MAINWDKVFNQVRKENTSTPAAQPKTAVQKREIAQRQRAAAKLPSAIDWDSVLTKAREIDRNNFGDVVDSPEWRGYISQGWDTGDYQSMSELQKAAGRQGSDDEQWYNKQYTERAAADLKQSALNNLKRLPTEDLLAKMRKTPVRSQAAQEPEQDEMTFAEYVQLYRSAENDEEASAVLAAVEKELDRRNELILNGEYEGSTDLKGGNNPWIREMMDMGKLLENPEKYRNAPAEEPLPDNVD